jgi:hypothetical protein
LNSYDETIFNYVEEQEKRYAAAPCAPLPCGDTRASPIPPTQPKSERNNVVLTKVKFPGKFQFHTQVEAFLDKETGKSTPNWMVGCVSDSVFCFIHL